MAEMNKELNKHESWLINKITHNKYIVNIFDEKTFTVYEGRADNLSQAITRMLEDLNE